MSAPTEEKKADAETAPALTTETPAAEQSATATESAAAEKTETDKPAASTTDEATKPEPAADIAAEGEASKTDEAAKPDVPAKDEAPAKPSEAAAAPAWPEISDDHPINKLLKALPDLITGADGYNEVYGIHLDPTGPFHTKLILQKFLRANANDVDKAKNQLAETLKWRGSFKPLAALDEAFAKDRYEGLGYVIEAEGVPESPNKKDIITFNIYGAVKDNKATFGDVEAFLRWRVALMEMGIKKLNLANATQPIPDYGNGPDPYQGIQVHDYLSVSFIRQDPNVKAASRRTIDLFSKVYPETLSRKFFVNVPVVMGWMFQTFKLILPKETTRKFTVLSYGNQLASELGPNVPEVYGGKTGGLETIGEQTKF
ncbi:Cellular retinaldehyde-binding/triple function [Lasiodiplodia theobromae]|uniref:Phosphatidylinositol transfer protein SFH5 n=1 Tax=Lasiodiplodia theobromae TaxID=45133 RepID=A0A5N5DPS8_9PEZI|nr:Phosphatidylinositol transfer protein SFH5 [Lasiodiplodia theobromae]KAF9631642.1 Cellular retinaldehyde-binding/triple function [Lasiodiplodia theobromae]